MFQTTNQSIYFNIREPWKARDPVSGCNGESHGPFCTGEVSGCPKKLDWKWVIHRKSIGNPIFLEVDVWDVFLFAIQWLIIVQFICEDP